MATFARPSARPDAPPAPPNPTPAAPATRPLAAATTPPIRPALAPIAPAAPRPAENLSDQDLRRVYERYAEARRKNNEPEVSFDSLARNLREAAPKMREKYGKPVDFEVVLKDGKVGLKPVPRG